MLDDCGNFSVTAGAKNPIDDETLAGASLPTETAFVAHGFCAPAAQFFPMCPAESSFGLGAEHRRQADH